MRLRTTLSLAAVVAAVACLVVGCGATVTGATNAKPAIFFCGVREPTPAVYLGVFVQGFPSSTVPLAKFEDTTGVRPSLITYYPRFGESFDAVSACAAVRQGAVPLLQMDPKNVSLASIASGRYDAYLRSYATAVMAFGDQVVLSFGHEMNGNWYSWGYGHTSSAVFVAAWRHIVTVFRAVGANNVTWLWTVNVMSDTRGGDLPSPTSWWPGSSYVTWCRIERLLLQVVLVVCFLVRTDHHCCARADRRPDTHRRDGRDPAADQPARIADLFAAGIRSYGLLGLVWFDAIGTRDWRLISPAAIAAFRQGAKAAQGGQT